MRWEASYKIAIPMFLAGAEQEKPPELRPPSFKGLLRFWFRAVALPKLKSWKEVQKLERELFGSTDQQSSFFLDLDITEKENTSPENRRIEGLQNKHGLIYLGHGLINHRGQLQRHYLKSGGIFTLRLLLKKNKESEEAKFFLPLALKALGLFGGAGARSRRGFGSLSLLSLFEDGQRIWKAPANASELAESQRELLSALELNTGEKSELPDYTAFSNQTQIWIGKTGSQAIDLLNEIGFELLRYRSYGKKENGEHILPGREEAEQNFAPDHDLITEFCRTGEIKKHPARIVFGLPHNYFFSSTRDIVQIQPTGETGRRASPLFIHIHELRNDNFAAVLSLLPAKFFPLQTKIAISAKNRDEKVVRYKKEIDYDIDSIDYQIIEKFMERPVFAQKVVVWS